MPQRGSDALPAEINFTTLSTTSALPRPAAATGKLFKFENNRLSLIDDRGRLDSMEKAGLRFARGTDADLDVYDAAGEKFEKLPPFGFCLVFNKKSGDPYDLAMRYNYLRRQMTPDQQDEAIKQYLIAHPERSDRWIADLTKKSPPFVAKVRRKGVATGDIHNVEQRQGRDKRVRTATPRRKKSAAAISKGNGAAKAAMPVASVPPAPVNIETASDSVTPEFRQRVIADTVSRVLRATDEPGDAVLFVKELLSRLKRPEQ